ncbi:hypothetical protein FHG87_011977 [Trinorchestia longiramus]|nr:hypothetical protein FHG87_011977 [Trinorchestia longiramus]
MNGEARSNKKPKTFLIGDRTFKDLKTGFERGLVEHKAFCLSAMQWYARAFQVVREHFRSHEQFIFCYSTPSTWECEQGFSAFMTIKSKSRNRLDAPEHDFRCAVSKVMPRIDQLVEKKQIQPLH